MKLLLALFRHCPSITKEYVETEERLKSIYYPIEISPSVTMEEKKKKMVEWWTESMKAFRYSQKSFHNYVFKS